MRSLILLLIVCTVFLGSATARAQQQPPLPADLAAGAAKATAELHSQANKGEASAQWNLGFMYAKGQGVAKNDAEAAKWFRKAADQGFAAAQFNLGMLYMNGQGVTKNEAEGYKWLLLASRQGNPDAKAQLAQLEPKLTPAQQADGRRQADAFKPTKRH